jgi:hypothetical protein
VSVDRPDSREDRIESNHQGVGLWNLEPGIDFLFFCSFVKVITGFATCVVLESLVLAGPETLLRGEWLCRFGVRSVC